MLESCISLTYLAGLHRSTTTSLHQKNTISVLTPCRQKPQPMELSSRSSDSSEGLLCELHVNFLHVSSHKSYNMHLVGTVTWKFRKGKPLCFPDYSQMYWPRDASIFPFLVCLRPWETFREYFRVNTAALSASKSALELSLQMHKWCKP